MWIPDKGTVCLQVANNQLLLCDQSFCMCLIFFLSPKLEAPNVLLCLHEKQYRQRAKKPVDKLVLRASETNPKPVLLNMNEGF